MINNRCKNRINKRRSVMLAILVLFMAVSAPMTLYAGYGPGMIVSDSTAHPVTEDLNAGLDGGMICFLKNEASESQQMGAVLRSSDGKVMVIDGGVEEDAAHLLRLILENGGVVDAWLITHAHSDHVGGLCAILKDHRNEVEIKKIYYCFPDYSWYRQVEPGRIGTLDSLLVQLSSFPQERLCKDLKRGDMITVSDRLSTRVLNEPRKSYDSFAVNSSSVMYDVTIDGKHLVILGDMGENVGRELMNEGILSGISCDYLQLAHHGQSGVGFGFYKACDPKNCIWCAPVWLYESAENNPYGYKTWQTKEWVNQLNVQKSFVTGYGDVVIR